MRINILHAPLLCLGLLVSTSIVAQPYTIQNLNIKDGLSNNYVKHLATDRKGHIYIATESGLNCFDGVKITSYKTSHSEQYSDALNVLLYDDDENCLWIGVKFGGIYSFDCATREFKYFEWALQEEKDSELVGLQHATDGGIWMVPHYCEVFLYDKGKKMSRSLSEMGIKGVPTVNMCCFDDGRGNLYIGHEQQGMTLVNLAEKRVKRFTHDDQNPRSLPGNIVYVIYRDHKENLWVGTEKGLGLFNPRTEDFTVFRHLPEDNGSLIADHIYDIREMADGTLWIASDIGGISILDLFELTFQKPECIRFRNLQPDNSGQSISSGNIRNLLQDKFGNIWIGNYSSGVDFIAHNPPRFRILPYTTEGGLVLNHKPIWGLCQGSDGTLFLGGENEIVPMKNGVLQTPISIKKKLHRPYGQVFSMIELDADNLLLGIYDDGLLRLNKHTHRLERISLGKENVDVICFHKEKDGTVWVGTEYGIYTYTDGVARLETELSERFPGLVAYGITRDKEKNLWVATYGSGIVVFNRKNEPIAHLNDTANNFPNAVNTLYMDREGGIWAGTRKGLAYIKDVTHPEKFELYGYKEGLTDLFIRAIHEDKAGHIWLSTNNGISCWAADERRFHNYDHRDGISLGNFIESSVSLSENGILYFGSLKGVCYFHPETLIASQKVAPIQIIECREAEKFILPTEKGIELPHDYNGLSIFFAVPDYAQSNLVEYAYLMEGLDENDWNLLTENNQVTFRSLAPGKYTFKVKARLRNLEWDEDHIATLSIHIRPPLWLTWWAMLGYAVLITFVTILLLRLYAHRLKLRSALEMEHRKRQNEQELNNERLRFYTNITHELRTPLTLILGPLEDLVNDSKFSPLYGGKVKLIYDSALRLLNLINQILEFRKTETQNRKLCVERSNLADLVTEIGLRYKELNRNDKVKYYIRIDAENRELYYDTEVVTTILNNLMSNAAKYTSEGEIGLTLCNVKDVGGNYTEIAVSDTGYGIEKEALPHIFDRYYQAKGKHQASGSGIGLALVKSLADLHEALLLVESKSGEGTVFRFRMLTENTYPTALHKEASPLPVSLSPAEPKESALIPEEENDNRPLLLAIEDNDDIREYIAAAFIDNYRVLTAQNGEEGWKLAQEHIPDIIISDIMMPVMDGLELCRHIKEDLRTSHIPVILLTAKDSIQDKEEGYESGGDSYLSKPFSARLLRSRVSNLLDSRKLLANILTSKIGQAVEKTSINCIDTEMPLRLNRLDKEFLEKLQKVIEENLGKKELDVPFLCKTFSMSRSTFYRKIKGLIGITANEYIRNARLNRVLQLIQEEGMGIQEAAYASGFNSLSYFRSCFKEVYGMTPKEYFKHI